MTSTGERSTVDTDEFKALMSTFPSGVVIVTTADRLGTPWGLTCSSLCSVSLVPPLLLVCIRRGSRALATITERGLFAVNFLHFEGREAAEVFASAAASRFSHVPWQRTPQLALPSLSDHAHAVAECRVKELYKLGDHCVVVGEVAAIQTMRSAPPLLYGLRRYATWTEGAREMGWTA
jgi:flavin reductase (DIM6/NTAB) family NADH-FMN oxidoreductase RutF